MRSFLMNHVIAGLLRSSLLFDGARYAAHWIVRAIADRRAIAHVVEVRRCWCGAEFPRTAWHGSFADRHERVVGLQGGAFMTRRLYASMLYSALRLLRKQRFYVKLWFLILFVPGYFFTVYFTKARKEISLMAITLSGWIFFFSGESRWGQAQLLKKRKQEAQFLNGRQPLYMFVSVSPWT